MADKEELGYQMEAEGVVGDERVNIRGWMGIKVDTARKIRGDEVFDVGSWWFRM